MITIRVATSSQKIGAMGTPPGLLLNVRLLSYTAPYTESSNISKAQSRRIPGPVRQVHDEAEPPNAERGVPGSKGWQRLSPKDRRRVEPPTQHQSLQK